MAGWYRRRYTSCRLKKGVIHWRPVSIDWRRWKHVLEAGLIVWLLYDGSAIDRSRWVIGSLRPRGQGRSGGGRRWRRRSSSTVTWIGTGALPGLLLLIERLDPR